MTKLRGERHACDPTISFMNDIANPLAIWWVADVNMVRRGIGSDARIGTKFLYPGCGYAARVSPKDVKL